MSTPLNKAIAPQYARTNPTDQLDAVAWITFVVLALAPLLREQTYIFNTTIGMKSLIALPQIFFSLYMLNLYHHTERIDRRWIILIFAWLVWVGLGTLLSEHFAAALVRQTEWIVHGVFAYAVFMLVSARPEWAGRIIVLLCTGLFTYLVFLLLFWHLLPVPQEYNWVAGIPGFSNIRHMGFYAMTVVPLSLYLMAPAIQSNIYFRLPIVCFGFCSMSAAWFLLAWSGGRGPLLGLSASVALLILLRWKWPGIAAFTAMLVSAVSGALLSLTYAIPGQGVSRFFERTFEFDHTSLSDYSSSRTDIWLQVFERVLENPLFGLSSDGYLFDEGRTDLAFVHPHGSIPQIMLEWGIPGTFLFAAICIPGLLYLVFRFKPSVQPDSNSRQGTEITCYFALLWAVLSILALSLVDGSLYHAHPLMTLGTITGVTMAKAWHVKPLHGRSHILLSILLIGAVCIMLLHTLSLYQALKSHTQSRMIMEVTTYFPSGLADRRTRIPMEEYIRSAKQTSPCAVERLLKTASRKSRPSEAYYFSELEKELDIECN